MGGLDGIAYSLRGIRPARYPSRPAITACRIARAISGGSSDREMAVLIKHAAAPASMARTASEGAPMPASTTTGTLTRSTMRRMPKSDYAIPSSPVAGLVGAGL